jgi:hypothetical protein
MTPLGRNFHFELPIRGKPNLPAQTCQPFKSPCLEITLSARTIDLNDPYRKSSNDGKSEDAPFLEIEVNKRTVLTGMLVILILVIGTIVFLGTSP